MRYAGPYSAAATPTFDDLANASTAARQAPLLALAGKVNPAGLLHVAAVPNVHSLPAVKLTKAQKATLIDGYDGRSAEVKRQLEQMRKSLARADRELCPFCSLESTAQLDHFLPKAKWPEFSLYAPNLIPICPVCNQKKGSVIANPAGDRLVLLPTADQAVGQRVLRATMALNPLPRVTYFIDKAAPLAPADLALVERHFRKLGLADRYRRRAHSLTASLRVNIRRTGRVRAAANRAIHHGLSNAQAEGPVNSWRLALYDAIVANAQAFEDWLVA